MQPQPNGFHHPRAGLQSIISEDSQEVVSLHLDRRLRISDAIPVFETVVQIYQDWFG